MVKELLKKFGGAIFFYLAIFSMITIINYRFKSLEEETLSPSIAQVVEK